MNFLEASRDDVRHVAMRLTGEEDGKKSALTSSFSDSYLPAMKTPSRQIPACTSVHIELDAAGYRSTFFPDHSLELQGQFVKKLEVAYLDAASSRCWRQREPRSRNVVGGYLRLGIIRKLEVRAVLEKHIEAWRLWLLFW